MKFDLSNIDLTLLKEQIQEDLIILLDGYDEELIDKACQIVVDNFNKYGKAENNDR
jgi:hypothetical protein